MPTKQIVSAVLVAVLVAVVSVALAADTKIYPGSMCVFDGSYLDEDYWIDSDLGRANGTFYNETGYRKNVVCPMVADERAFQSAYVVVNNPANTTLSCTLVIRGLAIPANYWSDSVSTNTSGIQSLTFDVSDDPTLNKASHFIQCSVPPGGRIIRYMAYEDEGDLR